MSVAKGLAAFLFAIASTAGAAASEEAAAPGGRVVTEAEGPGAGATTTIRNQRDSVWIRGKVVRKVVINGDVVTRARGERARACTSIGSIGRCADDATPSRVDVELEDE